MSKFIHLAREFFNEGEMRDIFGAESFFPTSALYEIARDRGVFLSEALSREDLVNELSRHWYSWRQFQDVVKNLDSEYRDEKSAVIRITTRLLPADIEAAKNRLVAKRGEKKRESYTFQKISETKVRITAKYIERDPTRAKGLQREEKITMLDLDLTKDYAELFHGRDDRSSEIAYQLVSCLREARKNPDDLVENLISLRDVKEPAVRTQFFTELLSLIKGCVLLRVKDVKLEHFKEEDLAGAEEPDEKEQEEVEALEEETVGRIETAVLHGNNVLTTPFFQELSEKDYFISYLRWEVREKSGSERRVVLEAGFRDAQNGREFYFDAKKYYEKDDLGDDRAVAKNTRILDRIRFRKLIADAAFAARERLPTAESATTEEAL